MDICYLAFLAKAQIALANAQMLPKESQCTYLHNAVMLKQSNEQAGRREGGRMCQEGEGEAKFLSFSLQQTNVADYH